MHFGKGKPDGPQWEAVSTSEISATCRMKIDGGWLYRVQKWGGQGMGLTFVPADHTPAKTLEEHFEAYKQKQKGAAAQYAADLKAKGLS